jgi:lantibiotic modifying enzyme
MLRAFLMLISNEEFIAIVVAANGHSDFHRVSNRCSQEVSSKSERFHLPCWASALREMLNGLAELEFSPRQTAPLQKVCEAGSEYGLRALERTVSSELFCLLRPKAKRCIKNDLQRILVRVTRPSFALELDSFRCAYKAIYSQKVFSTPESIEKRFLGERPYDRLILLFKRFPVLAKLWSQLICQWCDSVPEFLARLQRDRQAISRFFFAGQPIGQIIDLHSGLSDSHNKGRAVMRVQFQVGSIMYKPRPGHGEQQWFELVEYLNARSLRPKWRAARVLCRNGYCWMEEVRFAACKNHSAARRFYERLGGMIAAAYLLRAVDCHRDNVIASGEYPVLVDAETLWHVTKTRSPFDLLYKTGFLPSSGRRSSYQYRSSVLGRTVRGKHTPHIGARPLSATQYENEIVSGFRRGWQCLLGTPIRRAAFRRCLQHLLGQERRRIYWSSKNYDAIRRASIQPAALRNGADRRELIARSCTRNAVCETVIRKEINALKRLDIPYFTFNTKTLPSLPKDNTAPVELAEALQKAVHL